MRTSEPSWIEPAMRDEAIRRLREGDDSLSREWVGLVMGRFIAITLSRMDQTRAAICDAHIEQGTGQSGSTADQSR
ncbi:MAG: hypothetical protein ACF8MJ_01855 [Phycisphaerales bacterium JB050]